MEAALYVPNHVPRDIVDSLIAVQVHCPVRVLTNGMCVIDHDDLEDALRARYTVYEGEFDPITSLPVTVYSLRPRSMVQAEQFSRILVNAATYVSGVVLCDETETEMQQEVGWLGFRCDELSGSADFDEARAKLPGALERLKSGQPLRWDPRFTF